MWEKVEREGKAAQKPARILPLQFSEQLKRGVGRGKKMIKQTLVSSEEKKKKKKRTCLCLTLIVFLSSSS